MANRPKKRPDGRYQAKVPIGRDKNGKLKYVFVYALTQRELEVKKAEAKQQSGISSFRSAKVAEWLDNWLTIIKDKVKSNTWQTYADVCRLHLNTVIGQIPLQKLEPPNIRHLLTMKRNEGLSSRRIQYIYVVLNSALNQALKDREISWNPCSAITKPTVEQREVVVISEEQFSQILDQAKRSPLYALYELAWESGMRLGELLGLPWSNVDFKNSKVVVAQEVSKAPGNRAYITTKLKSDNAYRTIPVPESTMSILKDHRHTQLEHRLKFGITYRADLDLVFPKLDGSAKEVSDVSKHFKKIIRKLAFNDKLHFHDIRHSHATHLVEMGVHQKAIQIRLGHASFAFTMDRYTHNTEKMQEGIAAKLEQRKVVKK